MKRERWHKLAAILLMLALIGVQGVRMVFAELPIVYAVLFYSPTCGHCHYVITEVLPPLIDQFGDQLQIVGVDATTLGGHTLYQAAIQRFAIPTERVGVPALIVDETVLVGSLEIPEKLPALIEQYLAQGGVDWPDIPGLAEALRASEQTPEPTPEATAEKTAPAVAATPVTAPDPPVSSNTDVIVVQPGLFSPDDPAPDDLVSKLRRDPAGNALSILLLVGILAVVIDALGRMRRIWNERVGMNSFARELRGWRWRAVAALCLVGLGVSLYMTYVETTHMTAVCGPIGDCNTVQQSPYAMLFGLIPVGVLGVMGYVAVLISLAGTRWARGLLRSLSESALFSMALLGTLFSFYLTFLEPFVIGATCVWCLTSATSMTLILLVLAGSIPVHSEPTGQADEHKLLTRSSSIKG